MRKAVFDTILGRLGHEHACVSTLELAAWALKAEFDRTEITVNKTVSGIPHCHLLRKTVKKVKKL